MIKVKEEGEKKENVEESKSLEVAWRYNEMLSKQNTAGEIQTKMNAPMGRGLPIVYKFDCSKPMDNTIKNSASHNLDKTRLDFLSFTSVEELWPQLVDKL